jgi:hypothetical protein
MTALHAIRFREEFEMRCERCRQWWPLTEEFWYPRRGLGRCLACLNARAPERRRAYHRAYWIANRERLRAYNRAYYLSHRRAA